MEYLYADNFRGFTNALLTIRDVNFFVGENSTGKTSMLSLLKLLKSVEFLSNQDFNAEDVELGNYRDIVSVNATDKSYFRVGLIEQGTDTRFNGFLMTFIEEEGIPFLHKYTYRFEGKQTELLFFTNIVKYRSKKLPEAKDKITPIKEIFREWVEEHKEKRAPYKGYKQIDRQEFGDVPLPLLTFVLFRESRRRVPPAPKPIVWLAPIRTIPKRAHDKYSFKFSSEGMHIPYVIKKILSGKTKAEKEQAMLFKRFIEEFGKESGLFQSIDVKEYDRRTKVSPFELDIILNGHALSIDNVGYGVSQVLPVVVELFRRKHGTWFAIQQPEIHIHPTAQASLGNVLFNLALLEDKKFLIETHSDFIIDRFRTNYRKTKVKSKPDAQIVFFERGQGENKLHCIAISKDGELPDTQPKAYRDFFVKEQMHLLGY